MNEDPTFATQTSVPPTNEAPHGPPVQTQTSGEQQHRPQTDKSTVRPGWREPEAEIIRQMVIHESDAIDQRVNWLGTMQGLLFAAVAFAWEHEARAIVYIISVLGIMTAASIAIAVWTDFEATLRWQRDWDEHKAPEYTGPRIIGYPAARSPVNAIMPWFLVPGVCILAWLAVLLVELSRYLSS